MKSSISKRISSLLICIYFSIFLLNSVMPSFAAFYSDYALALECTLMTCVFALNINVVLNDKIIKWGSFILLVLTVLSTIFTGGSIGGLLNMMRFLSGIMIFSTIEYSKKAVYGLRLVCLVIWIFNLVLAPTAWSLYESGDEFYNPNTVGMVLFYTSTLLMYFAKKTSLKMIILIVSIIAILMTQCRSALIAEVLYFVALYLPIFRIFFKHFRDYLPYVFTVAGVLFPKFYLNLYANNATMDFVYNGKGLFTGRQIVWRSMFDSLNQDNIGYVLGVGTRNVLDNGEIIRAYHNWYLGIIYVYGIPVFLLYFFIFIYSLKRIASYEIFCIVLGIMLLGFFETTALSGLVQTYIFICFLLGRRVDVGDKVR